MQGGKCSSVSSGGSGEHDNASRASAAELWIPPKAMRGDAAKRRRGARKQRLPPLQRGAQDVGWLQEQAAMAHACCSANGCFLGGTEQDLLPAGAERGRGGGGVAEGGARDGRRQQEEEAAAWLGWSSRASESAVGE
jgi:hypothetical protein